jgi:endonuclease/exonuclease/phosphatase family metal-dependent hydrolase
VQEVENINVLRMLNDRGGLGYRTVVLLEGDDQRGIDVGIMSKFPVVGTPKLHYIDPSRRVKTRGILEVRLQVGSKVVAVFSNHWPSQGNPDELRILAAKKLLEVMPKAKADIRIAAGDFNTTEGDDPHGLNDILTKPKRGLYFVDTNPLTKVIEEMEQPPGTHWYQKKWEYLDRIFVDSRSAGNLDSEFSIHVKPFMMTERIVRERSGRETVHIVPFRFSAEEQSGFADHLPIVTVFKMN